VAAHAARDDGRASLRPWSGYWWPHKDGGLTGPLGKYDQVTGQRAAQWEDQNHVSTNPPPRAWFGHCHAWSAASVCEKEPEEPRQVEQVDFGVGDLKGLLTACHGQDVANSYGNRYDAGGSDAELADLGPDELWRLLQTYVRERKIPLILDLEAGEQVWNYPVYEYRVNYQVGDDGWCTGRLQLVVADNNVDPDFVGTEPALHKFTFRVKMEDGAIVMGSGQWTGDSVQDHPDFGWYPYVAVAENPYVDVQQVARIVGAAVGGSESPDEAETPADTTRPPDIEVPTPPEPTPVTPGVKPPPGTPPEQPAPDSVPEEPATGTIPVQPEAPIESAPAEDLEDLLSPDELAALVINKTSAFFLDVQVDRGDGGTYQPNDPINVSVVMRDTEKKGVQSGYLYLFDMVPPSDLHPEGELHLVYPPPGTDNVIEVDKVYRVPADFAVGQGQHDLKAIVTLRPVKLTGFAKTLVVKPVSSQSPGRSQVIKPVPTTPSEPSKPRVIRYVRRTWVVHPRCRFRLFRWFRIFRKGGPIMEPAPDKIGLFAQDMCSYRVAGGGPDQVDEDPAKKQKKPR
jgi:hypothetical protein